MRMNRFVLAAVCVLASYAYGQSANLQPSPNRNTNNHAGGMSFSYDAQHDQIVPGGVQLKPHANLNITPTTGTIVVAVSINAVSHFEKGTSYHCSLLVIGGEIDQTNGVISGGIETTNRTAKKGICTLTIPYSWILPMDPAAGSGIILAVGVSAIAPVDKGHGDGDHGEGDHEEGSQAGGGTVQRSTLQVGGVDSLPANGATTTFAFEIVL
jgi:hypothetical protein